MKFIHFILLILLFCVHLSSAEQITADQMLSSVVDRLPQEPLIVKGNLIVRFRHGVVEKEMKFDMSLKWGNSPSEASYTLQNNSGVIIERLTVARDNSGKPDFKYYVGNPLASKPLPDLFAPVHDSDMSWMDMTLSFLWWKGGQITGMEEIKGRKCYVIEVPSPAGTNNGYAKAKLWIDEELRMLLQAEGYDASGKIIRKLWVKSFKKIDDRWMVKDLEISSYPEIHRTKLQINQVLLDQVPGGEIAQ